MGQKFSEFKKSFKMRSRWEGSRQSNRKYNTINRKDVSEANFSVNQSAGSDSNGNITPAPVNVNELYDPVHISTCDNRILEGNGNKNDSAQEAEEPATYNTSAACSLSSPEPEGTSKSDSMVKFDTSENKFSKSFKDPSSSSQCKKKRNHWVLKFNHTRLKAGTAGSGTMDSDLPDNNISCDSCVCTGYQGFKSRSFPFQADFVVESPVSGRSEVDKCCEGEKNRIIEPIIDLAKFNFENYPIEDYDEKARKERAREIAEGVEPPPGYKSHIHLVNPEQLLSSALDSFTALLHSAALSALSQLENTPQAHTQVDYMHCLVPDLLQITSCSFYWGKMDRYEAERLLEGLPEGAFLLRDSAQEEYLFSVSFRKYSRSLHARIEQWNHRFSFDCRDPEVFASSTVCGLIEHYKNLSCLMYYEPQLTIPLHRNFPFPLQHLCRATICSHINYDGINQLQLPKVLKSYLKEYHYKQRLRVRVLDPEQ
ncbi:unnamed protein product [Bemisia tabaci]|uniref:Suppressor of cytokine signaling 5 n=1 Tax=Bemisia tabaci TaxID=7038 RepID=A0A9P0A0Z8_BEMTA|nr:unnamed protein product [Bemisia tabaci]